MLIALKTCVCVFMCVNLKTNYICNKQAAVVSQVMCVHAFVHVLCVSVCVFVLCCGVGIGITR